MMPSQYVEKQYKLKERPLISVICPVYNEERYIDATVRSILAQDYPQDRMEVLLIDGGSRDRTRERVAAWSAQYPFIHLYDNPFRYVSQALNIGIENAKGEVIIRLDSHCVYPSRYFSVLVEQLFALGADNVGSVLKTIPADDSGKAWAMAIASSNKFGVGSSFRTGADRICETDTVPFGCFRRELFNKIGLFDEDLVRNQDDEFNARIIRAGGKIFLLPQIEVTYTARANFTKLMRMYFQYGLFKPLVNKKIKIPATFRQFVPVLFVAGLVVGLPLSVFFPVIRWIYLCCVSLYFIVGFSIGLCQSVRHKKPSLLFFLPLVFFLVHLSYGCGYWKGIWKVATGTGFYVKDSR